MVIFLIVSLSILHFFSFFLIFSHFLCHFLRLSPLLFINTHSIPNFLSQPLNFSVFTTKSYIPLLTHLTLICPCSVTSSPSLLRIHGSFWPSEEFPHYRTESTDETENLKWNNVCWSCCQTWHWKSPLWVLVTLNTETISLLPFSIISPPFSVFIFSLHMFKQQKPNPLLHGNEEVIMQSISMISSHLKAIKTGRLCYILWLKTAFPLLPVLWKLLFWSQATTSPNSYFEIKEFSGFKLHFLKFIEI